MAVHICFLAPTPVYNRRPSPDRRRDGRLGAGGIQPNILLNDRPRLPSRGPRRTDDVRLRALLTGLLALITLGAILLVASTEIRPVPSRLVSSSTKIPLPGASGSAGQGTGRSSPPAPASAPAGTQAGAPAPAPAAAAPGAPAAGAGPSLTAYQGLGAWVSLYDFAETAAPIDPAQATAAMAAHGVQTLYIETGRWSTPPGIDDPGAIAAFIDDAHAHGIRVVGWYLPGFANIPLDVSNSLAVLNFRTPSGQRFDGLAEDIEDPSAVGWNRAAFNAGIIAFSQRLRAAVGPGTALGAIVLDAVNNERAPLLWAGFPWPQIAQDYSVIMPMAYWSVTKPSRSCTAIQDDAGSYVRDVYHTTTSLMGVTKPMVIVGGVGDCDTLAEVQQYVAAAKALGTLGASVYSFETVEHNPAGAGMWAALQAARG
jgi:hypothetical protein